MAKDVEVAERGRYSAKDYHDPPPAPLIDAEELGKWSFYRAVIDAFIVTLLFLYITVLTDTVIGYKSQSNTNVGGDVCGGVGIAGIAWAFGGMVFILVYCTAGISGADSGVRVASALVVIMFIVLVASPELGAPRLLPAEFWSNQHRILLPSLQRGTTPASPDPIHTRP